MLACVAFVAYPKPRLDCRRPEGNPPEFYYALGFGILAPLLISIFISVSKYWTINYGYKSQDLTIDSFMLIGLLEILFFIDY